VRIVRETGKPIAQVARDLGINEGTLGNWFAKDRGEREGTSGLSVEDIAELKRLCSENADLRMERDVLKRSIHNAEFRIMPSPPRIGLLGAGFVHTHSSTSPIWRRDFSLVSTNRRGEDHKRQGSAGAGGRAVGPVRRRMPAIPAPRRYTPS
jgi:transposase